LEGQGSHPPVARLTSMGDCAIFARIRTAVHKGRGDHQIPRPPAHGASPQHRPREPQIKQGLRMRDAAFRSNKESPEADLVRDIALEPTKARAKLDRVKKALLIARARTLHLEAVELKLAAAIEAATPPAA